MKKNPFIESSHRRSEGAAAGHIKDTPTSRFLALSVRNRVWKLAQDLFLKLKNGETTSTLKGWSCIRILMTILNDYFIDPFLYYIIVKYTSCIYTLGVKKTSLRINTDPIPRANSLCDLKQVLCRSACI